MQALRSKWWVSVWLVLLAGCTENITQQTVHNNVIFEIDTVKVYASNLEKDKLKTSIQYISILYADLFQQAITSGTLARLDEVALSMGDKGLFSEMVIGDFLQDPTVKIPTDAQMRADIPQFVEDAYKRFYSRLPTAYEKYFLEDAIANDPGMTPELIYMAFALSNEYLYY